MISKHKPTILQINVTANSGSTGRIAEEIGNIIIHNGWESYIAFGRKAGNSNSNLVKIGSRIDQLIHGFQTRLFDNHGLASKRATKVFLKKVEEIKPDLIHLHNIHGYFLNYKLLFQYLKSEQIPTVWTLHDCWSFTGHCAYFDFVSCQKWKSECFNCPQTKEYPASYLFDNSQHNYNVKASIFQKAEKLYLVPVSGWLSGLLKESILSSYFRRTIRNGINISKFKPVQSEIKEKFGLEGKFIVLGVASVWERRKGFNDFLKLSEIIDLNTNIILVGLSKMQIKQLPSNIIGIERTESIDGLVELYSAADLFFNPTYEDNYPTTNLEAIACGTPVLTYNTGGSVESITSETGFIIEKGNIEGCLPIINQVRMKGKAHYNLKCQNYAEINFDKEEVFKKYLELYKEILAQ